MSDEAIFPSLPYDCGFMTRAAFVFVCVGLATVPAAAKSERVAIPGRGLHAGEHASGDEDERPARSVTLKAFAIDSTEVTRGDYAAASRRSSASAAAGRRRPTTDPDAAR